MTPADEVWRRVEGLTDITHKVERLTRTVQVIGCSSSVSTDDQEVFECIADALTGLREHVLEETDKLAGLHKSLA